jgi:hypothetical protein
MMSYPLNRPVRFQGTREQAAANFATHDFVWSDEDVRCNKCDCIPGGTISSYPCGTVVPRETVLVGA